jgi:hypothetical protein
VPVWSSNWESLLTFLACATQWRAVAGIGGIFWLGLDYTAADVVVSRRGVAGTVWNDLMVMEAAALPILNAREPL